MAWNPFKTLTEWVTAPIQRQVSDISPTNRIGGAIDAAGSFITKTLTPTPSRMTGNILTSVSPTPVPGPTTVAPGTTYQGGQSLIYPGGYGYTVPGGQTHTTPKTLTKETTPPPNFSSITGQQVYVPPGGSVPPPSSTPPPNFSTSTGKQVYVPPPNAKIVTGMGGSGTGSTVYLPAGSSIQDYINILNNSQNINRYGIEVKSPTGFSGISGVGNSLTTSVPISGISGISGGGGLLPGSMGVGLRSVGNFTLPTEDEERRKKKNLISIIENKPIDPLAALQSISGTQAQQSRGQVTATGQPLSRSNVPLNPLINLTPEQLATLPSGGFQGGPVPISTVGPFGGTGSGVLKFQNGMFGLRTENVPSPIRGGESTPGQFTPFGGAPFSTAERGIISGITEKPRFSGTSTPPKEASSKELVSDASKTVPLNLGSKSDTTNTIADRTTTVIGLRNQITQQNNENTLKDAALKYLSDNSAKLFGQEVTSEQIWQSMNSNQPGTEGLRDLYANAREIAKSEMVDEATGEIYKTEWKDPTDYTKLYDEKDPIVEQLNKYKTELETLKLEDPYAAQTVQQFADKIYQEEGILSTRALIKKKQDDLDAITSVYEGIADEIRNDPDFSKRLKANRMQFLSDESVRQTKVLQREIDSAKEDLKFKLEYAGQRINNAKDQYNVYVNERNFIQSNMDKINTQMEKAADNARAAFNTIVSNPELAKLINDNEIAFIKDKGYFPETFIKKIGTLTGTDFKSIIQAQTTPSTKTIYGVTKDGKLVAIGTVADVSQSAGGGGLPTELSSALSRDITRYQMTIAGIANATNLNSAEKAAKISSLMGELQATYGSNATALSIIRDSFGNAPTIGSTITGASLDEYQKDLDSELANIQGQGLFNTKKADAQRAKDRLLAKYPNQTSNINAAFKQYGV